jgi:transketolase
MEIVDVIYHELMHRGGDDFSDVFLMSKGHGCLTQYVILESLGILSKRDIDLYCTAEGKLGAHPDLGVPGIAASTGSLGHGLGLAAGQAYAEKLKRSAVRIFCVLSDGEFQEGSSWEAMMAAANLGLNNLIAFIDNNDFSGLERMSSAHKAFYPLKEKLSLFGWETAEVDGHDEASIYSAVTERKGDRPFIAVCKTVKGKGVSFMENVPIWHYRSPNPEEYKQALRELDESRR